MELLVIASSQKTQKKGRKFWFWSVEFKTLNESIYYLNHLLYIYKSGMFDSRSLQAKTLLQNNTYNTQEYMGEDIFLYINIKS